MPIRDVQNKHPSPGLPATSRTNTQSSTCAQYLSQYFQYCCCHSLRLLGQSSHFHSNNSVGNMSCILHHAVRRHGHGHGRPRHTLSTLPIRDLCRWRRKARLGSRFQTPGPGMRGPRVSKLKNSTLVPGEETAPARMNTRSERNSCS
jgi:hypothetical protein